MRPRSPSRGFACARCGSPSVALPQVFAPAALVRCGRCGAEIGTWAIFERYVTRVIEAETPAAAAFSTQRAGRASRPAA